MLKRRPFSLSFNLSAGPGYGHVGPPTLFATTFEIGYRAPFESEIVEEALGSGLLHLSLDDRVQIVHCHQVTAPLWPHRDRRSKIAPNAIALA